MESQGEMWSWKARVLKFELIDTERQAESVCHEKTSCKFLSFSLFLFLFLSPSLCVGVYEGGTERKRLRVCDCARAACVFWHTRRQGGRRIFPAEASMPSRQLVSLHASVWVSCLAVAAVSVLFRQSHRNTFAVQRANPRCLSFFFNVCLIVLPFCNLLLVLPLLPLLPLPLLLLLQTENEKSHHQWLAVTTLEIERLLSSWQVCVCSLLAVQLVLDLHFLSCLSGVGKDGGR